MGKRRVKNWGAGGWGVAWSPHLPKEGKYGPPVGWMGRGESGARARARTRTRARAKIRARSRSGGGESIGHPLKPKEGVQFDDILYTLFQDILYTPARAQRALECRRQCPGRRWTFTSSG